ncbi:hypothetical protein J2T13_000582 [Paenibacillus sp. DS2015]|uniref:hypothetical protein n=1 Tax=Paenibacillus sp. DS2015 TaxID=3373917 RepID=UPI003D1C36E8
MGEHKKDHKVKQDESLQNENILHKKEKNRVDYPRLDHNHEEEYAAEVAPIPIRGGREQRSDVTVDDDVNGKTGTGTMAGYIGLALGIASLFMWSIVLGPIAAVTGFYAYSQGSKTTGAWSMGLGILATISYFVLIPFAR